MSADHSDRACTLCRQRRVRCDKTLPACRRCSKFGQPCPGYPSRQRFIDQTDSVRNKLNDEVSPPGQQFAASLNSSRTASIGPDSRPIQRRGDTISHVSDTVSNQQRPFLMVERSLGPPAENIAPFTPPTTSGHASLQHTPKTSLPMNSPLEDFAMDVSMQQLLEDSGSDYFDLDIDAYYAVEDNSCGFFPGIPVSLPPDDELSVLDGVHYPQSMNSGQERSAATKSPATPEVRLTGSSFSKEVGLLVHLFVEFLAPWMDLFDFDAYFTRVLPGDALPNILLQSAVAAVAAKQTARHVMNGCAEPASRHYAYLMANYQNVSSNEWYYKAACYYDRGISHLRAQLQQSSAFVSGIFSPRSNITSPPAPADGRSGSSTQENSRLPGTKHIDEHHLFSAISVLSLYESLDDCFATSSQHLPGFLALFNNNEAHSLPRSLAAGRAAFWYFARKEALASYAHHAKPRIDPDAICLWVHAGMPARIFHFLSTGQPVSSSSSLPISTAGDDRDTAHYVLIWVLTKVIQLISASDDASDMSSPASQNMVFGSSTSDRSSNDNMQNFTYAWTKLRELLTQWYNSRPTLLIPHAVVETSNPYSVAVLQLYHFIQILLLINQPQSHKNQGSRLRMLKENSAEVEYHSREICAIASGRQPLAIQRHMSHPLQLAGAYFEAKEDRDAILELLRAAVIETSSPIEALS